jgi:hypothetical protein
VLARELEPASAASSEPATVDDLIKGLELGDHDEAARRAYELLLDESRNFSKRWLRSSAALPWIATRAYERRS